MASEAMSGRIKGKFVPEESLRPPVGPPRTDRKLEYAVRAHEALRVKMQRTLIDFLWTELKIAPTLAQSALLAKGEGHMDHYVRAKLNAVKAAEAVRHFMGRVADDMVRTEIGRQLAEVDRFVSTL